MSLPRPQRLARWILRRTQGSDARAFEADLAELQQRRRGISAWLATWLEILRTLGYRDLRPSLRTTIGLRPTLALRLALRGLRKDPATALTAVLILTLGLAAPTVFFSILWGVSSRPLPVPGGERIVRIEVVQPDGAGRAARTRAVDIARMRGLPEFEDAGGYRARTARIGRSDSPAQPLAIAEVDRATLQLLRELPVEGRIPAPDEGPAWLVGEEAWERIALAFDVELGDQLLLDDAYHAVAGVMPAGFGFPTNHHGWRVVEHAHDAELSIVARLTDGVSPREAERAAQREWDRWDGGRAVIERQATVRVIGFTRDRGEGGEVVLFMGLVGVGLALLVIAIANASNLLLVRSVDRAVPLAIQGALGAGRGQLALQTFLEATLLAAAGGAGGFLLAAFGAGRAQAALGQGNFGYYWIDVGVSTPVAVFTGALVLGTALLAGTLPVLRLWRADLHRLVKAGAVSGHERTGGVGPHLVSLQLALSCAALVGAAFMGATTADARAYGRALPRDEIAMVQATLVGDSVAAFRGVRARLAEVGSGVVELTTAAPGFFERGTPVSITDGETATHPSNLVGPRYFSMLDLDALQGRILAPSDNVEAVPVAVVSRSWVDRFMPGQGVVGRAIDVPTLFPDRPVTIVGVVPDLPLGTTEPARNDRIYFAIDQVIPRQMMLLVRSVDPGVTLAELRRELSNDDLTLAPAMTLEEGHRFMTRVQETFGWLILIGGGSGLVVAMVGLYGLLAFRLRQRRREFGIRLALGADGAALRRSVLAVTIRQVVPAAVAGCGAFWVVSPLLGILMLGGNPRALPMYAGVAGGFVLMAMIAAWGPAYRAGRVDPARTLRTE